MSMPLFLGMLFFACGFICLWVFLGKPFFRHHQHIKQCLCGWKILLCRPISSKEREAHYQQKLGGEQDRLEK
jgi:hypothetical protein